jgi:DNA-binding transcriptional ArsR family regulator
MALNVSDARSNPNDQVAHAAKVLGRSPQRAAIFRAIHYGKSRMKTASEIAQATNLSRKRVLEEGVKLVKQHIVTQTKRDGEIAYVRDDFYSAQRDRILKLASDPKALERYPTKYSRTPVSDTVTIRIPRQLIDTEHIYVDDIESFRKVRKIKAQLGRLALPERDFKHGLLSVLRQRGTFNDWGGEQNDLYTTNLRLRPGDKRVRAVFGLKGPAVSGKLTPKKMGKNGDQIQRLFRSAADLFVIQYWDDVDESVIEQMAELAKAKSVAEGRKVLYAIIDGTDSDRLALAYPNAFGLGRKSKSKAQR